MLSVLIPFDWLVAGRCNHSLILRKWSLRLNVCGSDDEGAGRLHHHLFCGSLICMTRRAHPSNSTSFPRHALSQDEKGAILKIANSPDSCNLVPHKVFPILADRGIYLASEKTFYRFVYVGFPMKIADPKYLTPIVSQKLDQLPGMAFASVCSFRCTNGKTLVLDKIAAYNRP